MGSPLLDSYASYAIWYFAQADGIIGSKISHLDPLFFAYKVRRSWGGFWILEKA